MNTSIRYSRRFFRDVADVFDWYELQQPGLGDRFRRALRFLTDQIELHPESFCIVEGQVRVGQVRNFPYGVYFEVFDNETVVFALIHLSRDPTTWHITRDDQEH